MKKCQGYKLIGGFAHKAPHRMNMQECVEAGTYHQTMINFKPEGMSQINNDILIQIQKRIKQLKNK